MPLITLNLDRAVLGWHATAGALFVAAACLFGFPALYGLAAIVLVEVNKESWFDPLTEGTPNGLAAKLKEGFLKDFPGWLLGSPAGFVLAFLAHKPLF